MLFPVLWMLETSIKENRDVYAVPAKFFGFKMTLSHYKDVFIAPGGGRSDLSVAFLNSVVVAGGSTALASIQSRISVSAFRPLLVWNFLTKDSVSGPKMPSG